ncbi:MAG TPA: DoxX family protein [Terriglobales bacterium]|nr:DoxX family protein [Terriglobales bacterium]
MKFLNSLQPLALLLLRVALGIIFLTHGYPKLAKNSAPLQAFFVQHGLPSYFVYVSGVLETFGGALLIIGLFTRWASLLLAIEMAVAIWKVHSGGGILAVHIYEFPLSLAVACFAVAAIGAGMVSVDHILLRESGGRPKAPRGARN